MSASPDEGSSRTSGGWEAHLQRSHAQVRLVRTLLAALGAVSPELAARTAVRMFRIVRRHRVPEREATWAARGRRFEIEVDGRRIGGLTWGEGPPVLLLHGWEGRASQMGAIGLALAAAGLSVVSIEAPGHGDQKPPVSSLWQFAGAVCDVVREAGPFAGFVGHSFGVAGACYALMDGSIRVEQLGGRLVFISPPGDLNDFFELLFSLLGLRREVAQRFVRRMELGLGRTWDEARYCTTLAAADVPLLIVHDEGDRDTPIAGAEKVARAWPRSGLERTTGLGHRRILRDADVTRRVADFLSAATRS